MPSGGRIPLQCRRWPAAGQHQRASGQGPARHRASHQPRGPATAASGAAATGSAHPAGPLAVSNHSPAGPEAAAAQPARSGGGAGQGEVRAHRSRHGRSHHAGKPAGHGLVDRLRGRLRPLHPRKILLVPFLVEWPSLLASLNPLGLWRRARTDRGNFGGGGGRCDARPLSGKLNSSNPWPLRKRATPLPLGDPGRDHRVARQSQGTSADAHLEPTPSGHPSPRSLLPQWL